MSTARCRVCDKEIEAGRPLYKVLPRRTWVVERRRARKNGRKLVGEGQEWMWKYDTTPTCSRCGIELAASFSSKIGEAKW